MELLIRARPIVAGTARGRLLLSTEPLSFWGGYDPRTGEIIDRRHPLSGRSGAGCVLVLPFTRGSSTSTAILLEAVRTGHAPAAIASTKTDPFLALASVVAWELYGVELPILLAPDDVLLRLASGLDVQIEKDGSIRRAPVQPR